MANPPNLKPESADTEDRRNAAASKLEDLLGSDGLGVLVRGVVLATELPSHVQGKSQKGKDYSFYARRSQVFAGPKSGTVIVSETLDSPDLFKPLPLFKEAIFAVEGARMDGRQMVLRAVLRD